LPQAFLLLGIAGFYFSVISASGFYI